MTWRLRCVAGARRAGRGRLARRYDAISLATPQSDIHDARTGFPSHQYQPVKGKKVVNCRERFAGKRTLLLS
jgi:hypothetical protein